MAPSARAQSTWRNTIRCILLTWPSRLAIGVRVTSLTEMCKEWLLFHLFPILPSCFSHHPFIPPSLFSYACTKNGYLFEIYYKRIAVKRVWHLLPSPNGTGGMAIHALGLHEAFCVTGSEDGVLRLWPLDFSSSFLEAEHEGSVTAVNVSEDGLKVLAGTSAVSLWTE